LLTSAGDNPERMRLEAAFAHLAGVAPIPASSGRTHRHRLNRGGDRAANNTLHTIVLVRMRYDERTRVYVERRTKEGLSKKDIMRCLKRFVAREVYHALTTAPTERTTQNDLAPAA
jgi:transposase